MIGTNRPSHQWFPALGAAFALAACGGGGGGGPSDPAPTVVAAAFVGSGGTPQAGDTLQLYFSEDVTLAAGALLSDQDVVLSGGGSLGAVAAAPTQLAARAVAVTLGPGVQFTPGSTTIALSVTNDAVRDAAGQLGTGGTPVAIGTSDGVAPTLSNVTVAAIEAALNGTGPAGGTLQVPPNGFPIDLTYSDNGAIATGSTQLTASVAVTTSAGVQPAGTNLRPFLTQVAATNSAASYRVPATVAFPVGPVTLTAVVVDSSGLASAPSTFAMQVAAFADALRPFETGTNPQQVWYLDFTRDVESLSTSAIAGGISVDVTAGANGRPDYEDVLHVLGLQTATPLPNVQNGLDSNQVVRGRFQQAVLDQLASLYAGANVSFTTTQPSGSFGGNPSVPYAALGFSRLAIAGSASIPGVLGVALFDPSNTTQDDNTLTDFQGIRLGVFLQTIADAGMGPPSTSQFRLTFGPLAPSLGGTAIGADGQDDDRLTGALSDARRDDIDAAIADFARFTAVVVAHECGHSLGLVQNGAMPQGLYGNDTANFPGSTDGHIRTTALFPAGATNVMSPSLSYASATNAATAFNRLNLAYLREQVFYGN